jgi:alkaline phosphatase D
MTQRPDMPDRRRLLLQAAALAGTALAPAALTTRAFGQVAPDDPFTLGVASGEPTPSGVVLWTRLAPRPMEPEGGMPQRSVTLGWEIAEDAGFRRIAARGQALAGPAAGHSVHVEVEGLKPAREYWYRFITKAGSSPVGRTVTAPPADADVNSLKIGFGSCQKYEAGFYGAYHHMVEDRPDLFLFLGDYIYEKGPGTKDTVRLHQNPEPKDVAGYRIRYATYKTDPLLQAAHAVAPWMVIWDDHEVVNDYGSDLSEVFNTEYPDGAKGFLRRRAAAYQAYYEHMPLRRRAQPVGPDMLLYRKLDWGRLAQFQFVDDRQYRSARACVPLSAGPGKAIPDCDERRSAARSMLGDTQERWLLDTLAGSKARWNLLAQQTLFAPLVQHDAANPAAPFFSTDGWDGSPATRDRIVARWTEASVSNPMVLGGDIHAFAAADVRAGPDDPVAAPSFVGGSISSLGASAAESQQHMAANPDLKLWNGEVRGYGRVEIGRESTRVTFRGLDDARKPNPTISTLAAYEVENGRHTVEKA